MKPQQTKKTIIWKITKLYGHKLWSPALHYLKLFYGGLYSLIITKMKKSILITAEWKLSLSFKQWSDCLHQSSVLLPHLIFFAIILTETINLIMLVLSLIRKWTKGIKTLLVTACFGLQFSTSHNETFHEAIFAVSDFGSWWKGYSLSAWSKEVRKQ